ncbi:hypothetical protein EST38_g12020 [Candolleomyces aberdarensis]|uniref:Uncharacterized protein n=1 Tax=Candolleomyces aberdarensis TaxID=2316362 RepID=A0A4Q2D6P9_9AGAR|nr:hypothetical protein EST38_g12020 [Candolleomyces aberdarensis]
MKFSFGLITTLISVALCGIVRAAPAPLFDGTNGLCADIAARDVADPVMTDDLVARARKSSGVNKAATSKKIVAVQMAQGQRRLKAEKKKDVNDLIQQRASRTVETKAQAFRSQANKGVTPNHQINAQADKIRSQEKSRVLGQARIDRKAAKTQEWAAKKKTPQGKIATQNDAASRRQVRKQTGAPSPSNQVKLAKNVKLTKQEKNNIKNRFQAARHKFSQTQGIPTRGQTVTVGSKLQGQADGRAARQAVFNNYLHQKTPIGRHADSRHPKSFKNARYSGTHGNANLRGTRPLPQNGKKLREFPLIRGSPKGWTGGKNVGPLRAVTYKQGGQRRAAVIGHDLDRGGDHNDHYLATSKD